MSEYDYRAPIFYCIFLFIKILKNILWKHFNKL